MCKEATRATLNDLANMILVLLLLAVLAGCENHRNSCEVADDIWKGLEKVLSDRREEVASHLKSLHQIALRAGEDSTLSDWFSRIQELTDNQTLGEANPQLQTALDHHFVEKYGVFYDMLLVDTTGFVFHSIRQESDYRSSLIQAAPGSQLRERLHSAPRPSFVGFEYYRPSSEPAAFHLVPILKGARYCGWLVFQQAINSLNAILTDYEGLGRTGEVYLVDQDSLMLSNSRFCGEGTILRHRVSTDAVVRALAGDEGRAAIEDYRGVPVFSAYEPLQALGCKWVIVAEMDQSEVLDRIFQQAPDSWRASILTTGLRTPPTENGSELSPIKVDMHEFALAKPGDALFTGGVATCTAVALSYPGRFAALAHLGPTDRANTDRLTRWGLQGRGSDLVGDMMRRISRFEVHPYEMDSLSATIIAPHGHASDGIVRLLIEWGISLDRIQLVRNRDCLAADIMALTDGPVLVRWHNHASHSDSIWCVASGVPTLGDLVVSKAACW